MIRRIMWPVTIVAVTAAAYSNTFSVPFLFDDIESIVENPQVREPASCWTRIRESRQLAVSGRPLVCWTLGLNYRISGLRVWSYHLGNLAIHVAAALTLYGVVRRTVARSALESDRRDRIPSGDIVKGSRARSHSPFSHGSSTRSRAETTSASHDPAIAPQRGRQCPPDVPAMTVEPGRRCTLYSGAPTVEGGGRCPPYGCALQGTDLAGLGALVWAVHPLHTESVTYIMQRTENLCGLFVLLTLYACIRTWEREATGGPGAREHADAIHRAVAGRSYALWSTLAIVSGFLGVFCKELIAITPILAWMYDRTFVTGTFGGSVRRHWGLYAGLVAVWPALWMLNAYGPRTDSIGFHLGMGPLLYLRTQSSVLLHYLRLVFWPDALVVSYFDWPIAWTWADALPAGLVVLGLLGVVAYGLWERTWWGFAGAWFFVLLAPTSSVVPIVTEIAAERRMYLPLAAVVFVVVVAAAGAIVRRAGDAAPKADEVEPNTGGTADLARRARLAFTFGGIVRPALALAVVAALGVRTYVRNAQYRSELVLWQDAERLRPRNPLVLSALGSALDADGQHEEALTRFQEAARLNAGEGRVQSETLAETLLYNTGRTLTSLGRIEEAIASYREALRLRPLKPRTHTNLAALLARTGRFDEAREHAERAVELAPRSANARNNLGVLLSQAGDVEGAMTAFREAVRLDPDSADAWHNLGHILGSVRRYAEAVEALRAAVRLRPDDAEMARALREAEEHATTGKRKP